MRELGKGTLFLIGGAAKRCLLRFVRMAGASRSNILILPHASERPRSAAREIQDQLVKAGAGRVSVLMPRSKGSISSDVTAVYMSGGSQSRLVQLLKPELLEQLQEFFRSGKVVGGSSAGAAAATDNMIADGMNDGIIRHGALQLRPGLGLVPGAVVDTHFRERGRFNRLMVAVSLLPGKIGIGLDEDTAVEICGTKATVSGSGHAWFFVPGTSHATDLSRPPRGLRASVSGIEASCLAPGESFDLDSKRWLKDPEPDDADCVTGERFFPR
jgi:cyanophycinase